MVIVYEVYLDIFMVENILANLLVLIAVSLILDIKFKLIRIFLAAFAGAVISCVILCCKLGYGVVYIAVILALELLMLCIMGVPNRKSLSGLMYVNIISFAYSKVNYCIYRLFGVNYGLPLSAVLVIGCSLYIFATKKASGRKRIYDVVLKDNGRTYNAKALYDSGNLLVEPMSGKAVSIIEKNEFLTEWMKNTPEKFKIIPYKSVGREGGMLEGIVIDQLIILKDGVRVVKEGTVIALYEGRLSKNGCFSMLLNHSLL